MKNTELDESQYWEEDILGKKKFSQLRFLTPEQIFMLTDLSVDQLNGLKCMLEKAGNQTTEHQVTKGIINIDGDGHWNADMEAIKGLIQKLYSP